VIVALASEIYSRPAKRITELSSRAAVPRSRRFAQVRDYERVPSGAPPERRLPDDLRPPEEPDLGQMRVYRTEQRSSPIRRIHIRVALVTAAMAFAIAVAVLTLPELVFGGSVAAHGSTTFFGSGHRHRHNTNSTGEQHKTSTQTSPTTSAPSPTTTAPSSSTTTPAAPPAQTAPQTTTPVTPPASGSPTPAPQGTSTPAQTPPGQ
jgi:cytoskeletal protein RodZ